MIRARRWVAASFGGPEVLRLEHVDVPEPGPGEVTIAVRACGMNPADAKHIASGQDPTVLPLTLGYEVSGVVAALGPGAQLASGGGGVGDAVVAFQIEGGYATALTVSTADVFAMPPALEDVEAANLLLVGTTAAEMLATARVGAGDTVLLHGASGAVGTSVLQQAALLGAQVIGTSSPARADAVRRFGGIAVAYGPGLQDRVHALAPDGVDAALDTAGTDEAVDVSLALARDPDRFVSIAAFSRAEDVGHLLGARNPASGPYRAAARARLLELASDRRVVPVVARTFPFVEARAAFDALVHGSPGGKLALVVPA